MNEVGLSNAQLPLTSRTEAVAKDAEVAKRSEDGNTLPQADPTEAGTATKEEASEKQTSTANLSEMVSSVNGYVQSIQRDLQFSVDQELEKTVVKVVDSDSGKLIRQIPEDVFLDLARNLMQKGEFQLLDAQG